MIETALAEAVDLIYDALADDGALERLTGGLATILGASTGWFPLLNTTTGEMRLMAPHNVSLGAVWDYAAYYHQKDPWLAAAALRPPNTVMRLEETLDARAQYLEGACDRLAFGVARCDSEGRILYANRAAVDFLARQDGLCGMVGGRIGAIEKNDADRLVALIARAARDRAPGGGALSIRRLEGCPAYRVVVAPMRPAGSGRMSLLMIDDPEHVDPDFAGTLDGLYGFTLSEAALAAALVQGDTVEGFAHRLGVPIDSVRSQLKSLFLKTGTRRQIDLVVLLSRIPMISGRG